MKLNLISSIEVGSTDESENKRLFLKVEEGLKKGNLQYSVFRVPTLYGPWQPSFMMFHQLILSELGEKECRCTIEEKGNDLLYVEDVNTYGKMERTGSIMVYTIYLVVNSHYGKKV